MVRMTTRVIVVSIALVMAHTASAAELSAEYLEGRWSLDGKEACGSDKFEYVLFRKDGLLETGNSGRAHGAGFWEIREDDVMFHLSTSPASR